MKDKICPECGSPIPWDGFEWTCEICGYPIEPTVGEIAQWARERKKLMSEATPYYVINIECDHLNHVDDFLNGVVLPDEFMGYTDAECVKQARTEGWVFHKDGRLTCPDCRRNSNPVRAG